MGDLLEIDVTAWPLVIYRFPKRLDMATVNDFVAGTDKVFARQERFATIIDTSALEQQPGAIERRHLIEEINRRTFLERIYNMGNGVVIVSAAARAVLTAVNWLRPPVTPQYLVRELPEALEWSCGRLVGAGVALSPELQALRAKVRAEGTAKRGR